jgi:transcriptional regulator with XRE-family HTH domain
MDHLSHNDITSVIGTRVREIRTRFGLSIRDLADKVGVSYLTIQRLETDKTNPSVVLLADIAACLNHPITDFLTEEKQSAIHIKAEDQNVVDTKKMKLKLVAPKGIVDENISIVHGKAKKGKISSWHKHHGFEMAYVIKGKALLKCGSNVYELNESDLIFWNADELHESIALEPHEWVGMQFYSDTVGFNKLSQEETVPGQKTTEDAQSGMLEQEKILKRKDRRHG